jgi:2-polyprenyl-3-methyl-5-hydroxy-6-metoxy-1,4-benzoquinol methylase
MSSEGLSREQQVQEDEYTFPYHYIDLYPKCAQWTPMEESFRAFVLELLGAPAGRSVLDVGCGDGRLCYEMSRVGWRVTGIDYSERAIAFGRAFASGVDFVVGDLSRFQPEGRFDAMTAIEVLEHIRPDALPQVVLHMGRCLADDGVLVVSVPSTRVPVAAKHYQHFTRETLAAALAPQFAVTAMYGFMRPGFRRTLFDVLLRAGRFLTPLSDKAVTRPYYAMVRGVLRSTDRCAPEAGERIVAVCRKSGS